MKAKGQWLACVLHFCSAFTLLWRKTPKQTKTKNLHTKPYYFCRDFRHLNGFCCWMSQNMSSFSKARFPHSIPSIHFHLLPEWMCTKGNRLDICLSVAEVLHAPPHLWLSTINCYDWESHLWHIVLLLHDDDINKFSLGSKPLSIWDFFVILGLLKKLNKQKIQPQANKWMYVYCNLYDSYWQHSTVGVF